VDLLELRRDAVGHLAGTPGADDGALTASGAVANEHVWKWDAEGRLIEKSSEDGSRRWRLKWDAESHLVSVGIERDGRAWASVQLRYDGLARLVRKRVTRHDGWHSETYWLWDGECMAGERTRTWTPDAVEPELMVRDYLLDPVDLRLLVECDQAKAARAAVDERGRIVWHIDFDAFGRPRGGDLEQLGRVPFRFLGQLADVDLGFHYNYHRWYDPDLGAYLTSDPLGLAGGLHTWNYVPSPFDAWDPFGLIHHNDPGHYVYGLYSPEPPKPGQKPYYVGITNDLDKRGAQHQASGRLVEEGRPYRLDGPVKYGTARGYEQAYIEHFETKTGTRGALMGSPEKPLRGKARGNRANSFDINNTKRWAPRHKAFCKARKEKLKSLKPSCS
jgi:RHS repeat-associated protein